MSESFTIAVVVAMEAEAQPLRDHYGMRTVDPSTLAPLPGVVSEGHHDHARIVLATSGRTPTGALPGGPVDLIGTVPAALTLQRVIEVHRPDLILNVGVCGGYASRGATIGQVYVADAVYFHDRRVPDFPGLEGWHEYFKRDFLAFDARPAAAALGLPTGSVTTGDSFAASDDDAARIEESGALLKEMEAAAYAWTAALHRTPIVFLKAVTDIVDQEHANEAEFLENLHRASEHLRDRTIAFIDRAAAGELDRIGAAAPAG